MYKGVFISDEIMIMYVFCMCDVSVMYVSTHISMHTVIPSMYGCLCLCACAKERARVLTCVHACLCVCMCVCVCVCALNLKIFKGC